MSVNKYIDGNLVKVSGGPGDASDIYYKNTTSGLDANNVKAAIDELSSEKIDSSHIMATTEACAASTDSKDVASAAALSALSSNFQAGVDSIYNAIVAQGTTPTSKALSDIVTGITTLGQSKKFTIVKLGDVGGSTATYNLSGYSGYEKFTVGTNILVGGYAYNSQSQSTASHSASYDSSTGVLTVTGASASTGGSGTINNPCGNPNFSWSWNATMYSVNPVYLIY